MSILEYKLEATDQGMKCPAWIEDGGYWVNSADFTMVGVARDNAEWYTPDTVVVLTPLELEDRQVAIHTANPMMKHTDTPTDTPVEMTEAEVRTAIQDWVASKG
jgi:hypothetical protein